MIVNETPRSKLRGIWAKPYFSRSKLRGIRPIEIKYIDFISLLHDHKSKITDLKGMFYYKKIMLYLYLDLGILM